MVARGGFIVSCEWNDGVVTKLEITAREESKCRIKLTNSKEYSAKGAASFDYCNDFIVAEMNPNDKLMIVKNQFQTRKN